MVSHSLSERQTRHIDRTRRPGSDKKALAQFDNNCISVNTFLSKVTTWIKRQGTANYIVLLEQISKKEQIAEKPHLLMKISNFSHLKIHAIHPLSAVVSLVMMESVQDKHASKSFQHFLSDTMTLFATTVCLNQQQFQQSVVSLRPYQPFSSAMPKGRLQKRPF